MNGPEFRASQLEHDRDEEVCIKMDELAQKDLSHHMTESEYFRYKKMVDFSQKLQNIWTIEISF